MDKVIRKLSCLVGNHHYADINLDVEYVTQIGKNYLFRAKNRCVDCGKPYEALFQVSEDDMKVTEVMP